jgi:hypothetical protein
MADTHLVFKREILLRGILNLSLLVWVPCTVWMAWYAFSPSYPFNDVIEVRSITCLLVYCSWPLLKGRIYAGDIHVDDDGLGWWVWGRRYRYIRWVEIQGITVTTIATPKEKPRTATTYSFYKTEKRPFWYGLRFDDHIPNANALIEAVDQQVQKHSIPVLDQRGKYSEKSARIFFFGLPSDAGVRRNSIK